MLCLLLVREYNNGNIVQFILSFSVTFRMLLIENPVFVGIFLARVFVLAVHTWVLGHEYTHGLTFTQPLKTHAHSSYTRTTYQHTCRPTQSPWAESSHADIRPVTHCMYVYKSTFCSS